MVLHVNAVLADLAYAADEGFVREDVLQRAFGPCEEVAAGLDLQGGLDDVEQRYGFVEAAWFDHG